MDKLRVGIIGLGQRGSQINGYICEQHENVVVSALCDLYEDRIDDAVKACLKAGFDEPFKTNNYREMLSNDIVDCIIVASSWKEHIDMAIACLEKNIPCGCEVGGTHTIDECYKLVDAYERTKTPFMFLENCCYGRRELMALNMAKMGLFGEIVHCTGGYMHDLRYEVSHGKELRHYRLNEYLNRNCENYPTHEIGPIAKILDINNGNRFVSLTSTASKAQGLSEYILEKKSDDKELIDATFKQGDIITTVIKCERGETVRITLDTTLPRYYSRDFSVRGTKGMYEEATDSVLLDSEVSEEEHSKWKEHWGNADKYAEKYDHEIWKKYLSDGVKGGHDGMDYLVFRDFFDCVKNNKEMPIDVYDAVSWMCITPLSEKSIANGSMSVEFPDFKNRK